MASWAELGRYKTETVSFLRARWRIWSSGSRAPLLRRRSWRRRRRFWPDSGRSARRGAERGSGWEPGVDRASAIAIYLRTPPPAAAPMLRPCSARASATPATMTSQPMVCRSASRIWEGWWGWTTLQRLASRMGCTGDTVALSGV